MDFIWDATQVVAGVSLVFLGLYWILSRLLP